ncbi:MAG: S24/S26 family peptidase [Clostridia bacterium]|nr:S24/S26 family peptidase [Clostridia bacterium]
MSGREPGSFERVLDAEGVLVYRIEGISMLPLLRQKRDIVVITKPQGRLKKYDVALYRRQTGNYVLHRVVKVTDSGYVIRGDNLFFDETDITDNEIVGVLSRFRRRGREYSVNALSYRLYARLWVGTYRLRRFLRLAKGFLTEGLWVHLRRKLKRK